MASSAISSRIAASKSGAVGTPPSQAGLGFTSQYTYTSNLGAAGTFFIGSNPNTFNGFFPAFQNGVRVPTPNSGDNQLIINGASAANTRVWEESGITILPNTDYFFSVFVQSVTDTNPAILDFTANGVQLGSTFTASATTGVEQEFFATFFSGRSTTVDLALVDQDTASGGNDFALDDFVFNTTAPTDGTPVGGTGTTPTPPNSVPEPSSLLLVCGGLLALTMQRRRLQR